MGTVVSRTDFQVILSANNASFDDSTHVGGFVGGSPNGDADISLVVNEPKKYWIEPALTFLQFTVKDAAGKALADAQELEDAQIARLADLDAGTVDASRVAAISSMTAEDLVNSNLLIAAQLSAAATPAAVNALGVNAGAVADGMVQVNRSLSRVIGGGDSLSPFGRDYVSASDATQDTTTSSTPATKVSIVLGDPISPVGTFIVMVSALLSSSNFNAVAELSLFNLTDSVEILDRNPAHQQSDSVNVEPSAFYVEFTLDGSEQKTLELRYSRQAGGGGGNITISDAMIAAWRIG